jgi:hypothetical protein
MVMKRAKCFLALGFPYWLLLIISSCLPHVTSLSFNYNFSDTAVLAGADLKYFNDSVPALDWIDLTNHSRKWSTGRVAHGQAVRLWDDSTGKVASFTSDFVFAIKPANNNSQASRSSLMACLAFFGIVGASRFVNYKKSCLPCREVMAWRSSWHLTR